MPPGLGLPTDAVADRAVDAKQKGSGFTPILSLFTTPVENLVISVRYELNTKLELENQTTQDDTGLFPDGAKERNDIPAILSFGAGYGIMPNLRACLSFNMFFDKNANWEGREDLVDSNSFDLGIGFEYDVTESVTASAGYLYTKVGVSEDYQSDLSHELSSSSLGFGARLKLSPKLDLDLGVLYVMYKDAQKTLPSILGSYLEKYSRTTWAFAIGFGYHL